MTAATLTRSQRAMQIERRTSRQWTLGTVGVVIPSQTTIGRTYTTTLTGCSCPDHFYRSAVCKHIIAARIFQGRNAA